MKPNDILNSITKISIAVCVLLIGFSVFYKIVIYPNYLESHKMKEKEVA